MQAVETQQSENISNIWKNIAKQNGLMVKYKKKWKMMKHVKILNDNFED